MKYKKGVSKALLELCVGSGLEQQRLAKRDTFKCESVVIDKDGAEMGAEKWLKLHKKNCKN